MADSRTTSSPSDRHRHAHRPAQGRRRGYALLIAVSALVATAIAVALVLSSADGPDAAAAADQAAGTPAASTTPVASATPTSPPATAPAPAAAETATPPDVPVEFVEAMQQIGIPLDAHTGWVVAQGICVRLGQPDYDQFRMSEGVERLFPSVPDEQAHEFVAMVAESVCHL